MEQVCATSQVAIFKGELQFLHFKYRKKEKFSEVIRVKNSPRFLHFIPTVMMIKKPNTETLQSVRHCPECLENINIFSPP